MNAEDRAPAGPGQPTFTPLSADAPVRRAAMPPAAPQPGAGAPPTSAGAPQRTAFRPGAAPAQPGVGQPGVGQPVGAPGAAPAQPGVAAPRQSPFPGGTGVAPAGSPFAPTAAPAGAAPATRSVTGSVATGRSAREVDAAAAGAPRKVRVLLSRIDPLSALKIGFLLSVATAIMLVVATHIIWVVLDSGGTFDLAEQWVKKLFTAKQTVNILQFTAYPKVMSAAVLVAVFNTALLSGLSVLVALIYNAISRVVGGVYVTLTDD